MSTYPKSPKELTGGLMFFPRLLDKVRLHASCELAADYHENFGKQRAGDGMCCNFLRVNHEALRNECWPAETTTRFWSGAMPRDAA